MAEGPRVSCVVLGNETIHHPLPLGWHPPSLAVRFLGLSHRDGSGELFEDLNPTGDNLLVELRLGAVRDIEREDVELFILLIDRVPVFWSEKSDNRGSSTHHIIAVPVAVSRHR